MLDVFRLTFVWRKVPAEQESKVDHVASLEEWRLFKDSVRTVIGTRYVPCS
jgi:hypothetical protein